MLSTSGLMYVLAQIIRLGQIVTLSNHAVAIRATMMALASGTKLRTRVSAQQRGQEETAI